MDTFKQNVSECRSHASLSPASTPLLGLPDICRRELPNEFSLRRVFSFQHLKLCEHSLFAFFFICVCYAPRQMCSVVLSSVLNTNVTSVWHLICTLYYITLLAPQGIACKSVWHHKLQFSHALFRTQGLLRCKDITHKITMMQWTHILTSVSVCRRLSIWVSTTHKTPTNPLKGWIRRLQMTDVFHSCVSVCVCVCMRESDHCVCLWPSSN